MARINWTNDKILSRILNNKSDKTRWDNIRILRQRPSYELFTKSTDLLKSVNKKERLAAIDILSQLGGKPQPYLHQTVSLFFVSLDNENDPEVLASLLTAIGHNNADLDNEQVNKLCAFVDDDNNAVREALIWYR